MTKPFAMVTGASSGIGLELAATCGQEGFDLLIAADRPEIQTAAGQLRSLGATVTAVEIDLATTEGVDQLLGGSGGGRPAGRRALRQCRPWPGACVSRSGLPAGSSRHRYEHYRDHLSGTAGRQNDAQPRPGAHPADGIDRRIHAGHVSSRL